MLGIDSQPAQVPNLTWTAIDPAALAAAGSHPRQYDPAGVDPGRRSFDVSRPRQRPHQRSLAVGKRQFAFGHPLALAQQFAQGGIVFRARKFKLKATHAKISCYFPAKTVLLPGGRHPNASLVVSRCRIFPANSNQERSRPSKGCEDSRRKSVIRCTIAPVLKKSRRASKQACCKTVGRDSGWTKHDIADSATGIKPPIGFHQSPLRR